MRRLAGLLPLLVTGLALYAWARDRWPWERPVVAPAMIVLPWVETVDTLHPGETLSGLFARNRVAGASFATVASQLSMDLRRLRPGTVFAFRRHPTDSLPAEVTFRLGRDRRATIAFGDSSWLAEAVPIDWRADVVRLDGSIDATLYEALDGSIAGDVLPKAERDALAWDLADIFAWEVDFTRDIRPGDHYTVLAERLTTPDGEVRFSRVLAGDLVVGGRRYTAFRYDGPQGTGGYYDADGRSLRRAFLRAPLQFRRLASGFGGRMHPILGRWKQHEGLDYSAAYGTPVMAAGDGVVIRAGRAGGYGNLVELRHANGITTRYGHLSQIRVHVGQRVRQEEVIGNVGATGLATGPHLHYEFRVGGVARDPRAVKAGDGTPVAAAERPDFDRTRARLAAELYPPQSLAQQR
ncbi:MAG TPA: peptidoglycan DD-metalloendopeptidase family protein [Gemmatimonadales bacterium]|jgi:murein DD-endopeptidase MepM/ murein hydrolase activator NlpD|nr:peptidoglycan DD-metalloendopeptidase family protein [Gemmatimonadales bacterium]